MNEHDFKSSDVHKNIQTLSHRIASRNDQTGSVQALDITKRESKRRKRQKVTIKPVLKLTVNNLEPYDHNSEPIEKGSLCQLEHIEQSTQKGKATSFDFEHPTPIILNNVTVKYGKHNLIEDFNLVVLRG